MKLPSDPSGIILKHLHRTFHGTCKPEISDGHLVCPYHIDDLIEAAVGERIGLNPDHICGFDHIGVGALLPIDEGDIGQKRTDRFEPGVMATEDNDPLLGIIGESISGFFFDFRLVRFFLYGEHNTHRPEAHHS